MAMEFLNQGDQASLLANTSNEHASLMLKQPLAWSPLAEKQAVKTIVHQAQKQTGRSSEPDWTVWLDKVRWVFGYGSLIWNPEIPVVRGLLARVDGYHRRFCINSTRYRGTHEQPGVVLGLDRGGRCHGMAWELVAGQEDLALKTLWAREMRNGAYRAKLLKVRLPSGEYLNALGFVARREHPNFLRLREDELLRRLAQCRGDRGSNQDYLANTVHALQHHGISDQKLQQLLKEVQAQRSN